MKPLAEKVEKYVAAVKDMNIRDWVVRDKGIGVMKSLVRKAGLILTFPLFLYGFLTNIIPFWLPAHMARNIKDRQFRSSIKAGLGILVIFPLWYFIMTLLVMIFTGPWWIWVLFLAHPFPNGQVCPSLVLLVEKDNSWKLVRPSPEAWRCCCRGACETAGGDH